METIDISEPIVKPSPKKRITKKTEPDNVDQPTPARKRITTKKPTTPEPATPEVEPATPEAEPVTPEAEPITPEPELVKEEPLIDVAQVDEQTTTKTLKGHRPKKEDKDYLLDTVQCEKCDTQISLHAKKYTHKKNCPGSALAAETEPSSSSRDEPKPIRQSPHTIPNPTFTKPTSMRDQILEKRMMIASKLIAQAFYIYYYIILYYIEMFRNNQKKK